MGLREVCFCPASGSQDVGEEALAIDSFRVYASALGILEQKAQEAGARLTFADIKGQNASAGAVEKDLDFSRTETANGLKIMGWKSSNTAVVTTAGKVTRPQSNDLRVTLTPVLGMEDAMNEADGDYITTDGAPITVTVKSIGGGEVKPENIFEYELNESFDAADYNAKEHPMGWANGWGDTNNTGKAEVKEGAMWIIHTKGVNESKYQVEIPFTYGYTASGGGSPICAVLPRDDLFVDFKWITDPKTREMTWYQCGKGSDAYTTSYVMRYNEETKKWDIQLRYRSGGEWKEMGVMKDLDLYSGENSVRIHLDASRVRQNCLKGAVDQRPSGGREPVRNGGHWKRFAQAHGYHKGKSGRRRGLPENHQYAGLA